MILNILSFKGVDNFTKLSENEKMTIFKIIEGSNKKINCDVLCGYICINHIKYYFSDSQNYDQFLSIMNTLEKEKQQYNFNNMSLQQNIEQQINNLQISYNKTQKQLQLINENHKTTKQKMQNILETINQKDKDILEKKEKQKKIQELQEKTQNEYKQKMNLITELQTNIQKIQKDYILYIKDETISLRLEEYTENQNKKQELTTQYNKLKISLDYLRNDLKNLENELDTLNKESYEANTNFANSQFIRSRILFDLGQLEASLTSLQYDKNKLDQELKNIEEQQQIIKVVQEVVN